MFSSFGVLDRQSFLPAVFVLVPVGLFESDLHRFKLLVFSIVLTRQNMLSFNPILYTSNGL